MVKITTDIAGIKELDRALKQLPDFMQTKVLEDAMKKAAGPVIKAARAKAPRGRTGNLRKSIVAGTRLRPSQQAGAPGRRRKDPRRQAVIYVGTSWPKGAHGHLVEFGTVHSRPKPFLRPAWEGHRGEVLKSIELELSRSLRKAASRLASQAARGKLSRRKIAALSR